MWKYASFRSTEVNQSFCRTRHSSDACVSIPNFYFLIYLFRTHRSRIGRIPLPPLFGDQKIPGVKTALTLREV